MSGCNYAEWRACVRLLCVSILAEISVWWCVCVCACMQVGTWGAGLSAVGHVWLGVWRGREVMVNEVVLVRPQGEQWQGDRAQRSVEAEVVTEGAALVRLSHPNVADIYGACSPSTAYTFVLLPYYITGHATLSLPTHDPHEVSDGGVGIGGCGGARRRSVRTGPRGHGGALLPARHPGRRPGGRHPGPGVGNTCAPSAGGVWALPRSGMA